MWKIVKEELLAFYDDRCKLSDLGDLTKDTLHGSMWGLNYRYMTLKEALIKDKKAILSYSLQRIIDRLLNEELYKESFFTFKKRQVPRCRIGYGSYGW